MLCLFFLGYFNRWNTTNSTKCGALAARQLLKYRIYIKRHNCDFLFYLFQLAPISSFTRMSKQENSLWNPVLSDRIHASFICANRADINCVSANASVVWGARLAIFAGNESCMSSKMQRWIILSIHPGALETHCFSSPWNVNNILAALLLASSVWCRSHACSRIAS